MQMGGMDAIIAEFLAESTENLDQLDQDLISLEKNPSDLEVFSRIFRTIHTIKGTCGFLAFQKLEAVTHAGESVLGLLRDGTLALRPDITTQLLAMIDAVRAILANIDRTGGEGDEDYSALIERLRAVEQHPGVEPEDAKKKPAAATDDDNPSQQVKDAGPAAEDEEAGDEGHSLELTSSPALAESNLRVDVRVLDNLMNLVGELVLARNQLVQHITASTDPQLAASSQRLDGITGELQEAVMRTRMQPISSIWSKLPRFVRDLSLSFGKEVEIQMEGGDTGLDKSVIEAIKGSLLHLVRNAVDHGIESPEVRAERGKPSAGTLRLRAHHEGGSVVIEVKDDGGGLDHEKILARAIKAGLVDQEAASTLSRQEIESFIFHPGFSTAAKITNISGRGVGLDVVRANIESIGGTIELSSEAGKSTTFRVKIPLTLAIVSVLLVAAGSSRIAIPQASVVELVRLAGHGADLGIEDLNGVPVCRLRGDLLPLVFLNKELALADQTGDAQGQATIVVLQGDDRHFGLVVDAIEDSQEIVVKALGRRLAGLPFAGATILGDGQIALILDVFRLGLAAGVISDVRAHTLAAAVSAAVQGREERARLLCLQGRDDERIAVDFSEVSRLEKVPRSRIEVVGGHLVLQYGDEILQLVELQEALPERRKVRRTPTLRSEEESIPMVVCTVAGRRFGLLVHRIIDIVDESLKARRPASRVGVRACTVVRDRVTEILDLETVAKLADSEFFERPTGVQEAD
jgi:two-component system chemotaxis sensor kinase CheA